MAKGRIILEGEKMDLTILRLCHEIMERHGDFMQTCLIGIQKTGVILADRIHDKIKKLLPESDLLVGKLDVTFYRDDFRMREKPLTASFTELDFNLDGKRIILIDDVLYSGRTIRAAMDALLDYGRPSEIELLSLIDRRFNRHLPIHPDYVGQLVDTIEEAYVQVDWKETNDRDCIWLFPKKQ